MAAGSVRMQILKETTPPARITGTLPRWLPYLLALFFAAWSLRGVGNGGVTGTDAARHAMNGAFIYDLVRTGHILHPVEYAKEYYGRLPALSMPFHPPGFPAVEAVFFAVFGVNLLAARLAVSLFVAISAILLYRLVQASLNNDLLAACVVVSTLSAWSAQYVATDVMLEFPSLAFTLAALYCLCGVEHELTVSRALLYGILAAAAIWTKQLAVFLAAVPMVWTVFRRRWGALFRLPVWIASGITSVAVLGLILLSARFNHAGTNRISNSVPNFFWNLSWNVHYYRVWLTNNLLGPPVVFAAFSLGAYFYALRSGRRGKHSLVLYFAWIAAIPPVLMVVNVADWRYLNYLFPALFVLGYGVLWQGGISLLGKERSWMLPAGMAAMWFAAGLLYQPEFLHGPAQAAALVQSETPNRILYAGEGDGNFIFSIRSLESKLQTTVIPADKLPPAVFTPAALENFCRFYAIDWVVFEDVASAHSWSELRNRQAPSMRLEHTLPLSSSLPRWRYGRVKIYRFLGPRDEPGGMLHLPVGKLGYSIEVQF